MSSPARYLIAKYVADARRMEPVNVGVVLWANGRTAFKFLPPPDAAPLVNDVDMYERWVGYWRGILESEAIEPLRGKPIPKSAPEFVDEFIRTQKESYQLADAGHVIDRVPASKMELAADYLFSELVARPGVGKRPVRERRVRLRALCNRLFTAAGLTDRADFRRHHAVSCPVGRSGVARPFRFDYAVGGDGEPIRAVYHRVNLSVDASVHSAGFMFEQLGHSADGGGEPRSRFAALYQSDEATDAPKANESLEMLREFARVIDVSKPGEAVIDVLAVAGGQ